MKKTVLKMLAGMMAVGLFGCGADTAATPDAAAAPVTQQTTAEESTAAETTEAEPVELIVFAAASMTETLTEIGELYMQENPHVTVVFNFDSSGTLKTQIQEGAECDVFISAGQKQMNQLDITADAEVNTDGLDFVAQGTRIDLLENKVALCVAENSTSGIDSFDALAEALKNDEILFAMGNSDVPVGQYTQKIFAYYELNEEELAQLGKITYGSNVKEVTTQVSEGSVDCDVVYTTDAFSAGLTPVDFATAEMCGQVIYPAAVLNVSEHMEEAEKFLNYLQNDVSGEIFEGVGFTAIK